MPLQLKWCHQGGPDIPTDPNVPLPVYVQSNDLVICLSFALISILILPCQPQTLKVAACFREAEVIMEQPLRNMLLQEVDGDVASEFDAWFHLTILNSDLFTPEEVDTDN
jgi:hypothetical protein